ncbi:MAG: DNA-processing protein DprA [Clostridia bacterium]|nr:DNA-processing protein DprA [Clostridia bacterium]
MENNLVYWVWLQQALKHGNNRIENIRNSYSNIKEFYSAGEMGWRLCGCFTNPQIYSMSNFTLEEAEIILKKSYKLGYDVISIEDERYPELLLNIHNPPCVIYTCGDISCLSGRLSISIVGTRKATKNGLKTAYDISYDLAKNGAVIISGGALGVDSEAHKGALDAGGKTVAVLGCGIDYPYLLAQKSLRDKISQNGALISEYPPGFEPTAYTFPVRNRIISGLSKGTLIIEAGEKSGSLITANLANDQNRDVFVTHVENGFEEKFKGSLALIEDGAAVVTCAEDILKEYGNNFQSGLPHLNLCNIKKLKIHKIKKEDAEIKKIEEKPPKKEIPEEYKPVYNALLGGKMHIDKLSEILNLPIKDLNLKLIEMELLGLVAPCSGKMYEIIKK